MHITKRFIEQRETTPFGPALRKTFSSMLPALFLTSITTISAFLAQVIVPSAIAIFAFGLVVIIGIIYSFLLVCILWPALTAARKHPPRMHSSKRVKRMLEKIFRIGMTNSKMIILILFVFLLLSVFFASKIDTNVSTSMFIPDDVPVKEAVETRDTYTKQGIQFILIEGNITDPNILPALDRLENNVQDNELFIKIGDKVYFESINTLLRKANISEEHPKDAYDQLYDNEETADPVAKLSFADKARTIIPKSEGKYRTILVKFRIRDDYSELVKKSYSDLKKDAEDSGLYDIEGISVEITGESFAATRNQIFLSRVQLFSSLLMFVFTFIMIIFIYRKLSLSIIVSIPILFGSFFSLGMMGMLNIPLTCLNAIVIPLIIGLGVDYSIYMAQRYREELKTSSPRRAAEIALVKTGDGNWLAALSTTVGFIIVSFSFVPMAKSFGLLTAVSIILTFMVTIFLLPALLARFVKR